MYFPYFITYIVTGFVISLVVFFWALKRGQFRHQDRARFLPLEDETGNSEASVSKFNRFEAYGLIFLVAAGLSATAAVLIFAVISAPQ